MSYEILDSRQFVSLNNGTYIPIILSGSNNCTMYHNGREIRERHWWPFGYYGSHDLKLAKAEEELMQWIHERIEDNPDGEWFMRGGKWMLGKDMPRWMASGVKSARTLEEIRAALPHQSLYCSITVYDNTKSYGNVGYQKNENATFVHTTSELVEWINAFEKRLHERKAHESVHPNLTFSGIEPLKLGTKSDLSNKPVVCKCKYGYVSEYENRGNGCGSLSYNIDISKAIVFENEDDFNRKMTGIRPKYYRLVKADQPKKNFVIKISEGCYTGQYVEKKTRSRLHMTYSLSRAMRHTSEKAALKFIEDKLIGRFANCKAFAVEKIAENVTEGA